MKNQINIRHLKKHKIPIIAALAVIAVLLFAVIFAARSNKIKQREQEAALKAQEQAAQEQGQPQEDGEQSAQDKELLADASEYLKEIDSTITANTEHLAEAGLLQAETEKALTGFAGNITRMEESLTCIENLVSRQIETQAGENSEILLSVSALSESQKEIRSQIDESAVQNTKGYKVCSALQ